jgi:hypothetical protein
MRLEYERQDLPGRETVEVTEENGVTLCRGDVRLETAAGVHRYRYLLEMALDGEHLRLELERKGAASLLLERDSGSWRLNHTAAPRLAGATDVDLSITPVTNMLTVRRLGIWEKETETVPVVYVDGLEMSVQVGEQTYSCRSFGEGESLYFYQNELTGLEAEVRFGPARVLEEVEGYFRRIP